MRSGSSLRARLLASAFSVGMLSAPFGAQAADQQFDIAPQSLDTALADFSRQSMIPVLATPSVTGSKRTGGVSGAVDAPTALAMLLQGTGLTYRQEGSTFLIVKADTGPQSGSAAGDGAEVEALIVTAQKREEDIQDVPIAISAFTQEALERSQIAGGPDLMTQVPNMTFTKTNFSSYSIQLRGIGTQAISATTDAAVAVAFNNTPFIRNRFFEQEFYDLQRVEVLRGPQGTLYGRNATAGVVNIISQKPRFAYEAKLSADVSNYNSTRLEGMVNVPLAEDKVALRLAGAWTKREGYSTNGITGNPIDGRDLWSTRLSLRFTPNDKIDANLIWEHFQEDDDRLRSGKQLCQTDLVTEVRAVMPDGQVLTYQTDRDTPLSAPTVAQAWTGVQGTFSQGCKAASLYAPESFQVPNGVSLPYVLPLSSIGVPINTGGVGVAFDPYASTTQSRDLRVVESAVDPHYQAESDVLEFQFSADVADALTLTSETGYSVDTIFSTQDYNRFNTAPGVFTQPNLFYDGRENLLQQGPNGGIFCDPQIGCADRLVAVDLSTARSRQFSEELRIGSDYDGPFNFSLGANFLRYDTEDKYYVFINTLSLYAAKSPSAGNLSPYQPGVTDNVECMRFGIVEPDPTAMQTVQGCVYIDPNPIGSLNDRGHNYFLSRNPYKLISYAVFGEAYYNLTENLKVTAGLRWTVDKKEAPRMPSWILAANTVGYPAAETVRQEWREPTGRLTVDWKPDLRFTDETLLYASYAHGYKAGGMNPPASGIVCYGCTTEGSSTEFAEKLLAATHPKTFAPEFIDAFELGSKNTMLDGRVTLNLAAFYYDYEGYQISQIVNRSAINRNFDANVWGLEIEADWRPMDNLRLGFKGGYENTRVADGMNAVDVMDRTAGHEGWSVVRPFPTFPSNCVVPTWLFVGNPVGNPALGPDLVDVGNRGTGGYGPCELAYVFGVDPVTGLDYVPDPTVVDPLRVGGASLAFHPDYPGWNPATAPNSGAGFSKDLSGNELPNAPHFTATVTADYTVPLPSAWLMTLHTDLYYQSEAWARIFNTEGYDKLKAYTNVNIAAIFTNEDAGWKVMAYVKNVFDRANITGSFLNSDDSGLTTNVFMTEPRLYGLRVTKEFTGGPWWTGGNPNHTGPFPLTIELGGQVQRHDAPYAEIEPASLSNLEPELRIGGIQNQRLDWGDGRSMKVILRPANSPWSVSAGVRYGRTNGATNRTSHQLVGPKICRFPDVVTYYGNPYDAFCDPSSTKYFENSRAAAKSWTDAESRSREEHEIIDFNIGHDVGLGSLGNSTFGAGLRYASFESTTTLGAHGLTGWDIPVGWGFKYVSHLGNAIDLEATREFEGFGPTLSWDATMPLVGNEETGSLGVSWSATGGVLFGRQKTSMDGTEIVGTYTGSYFYFPQPLDGDLVSVQQPADRSESATVPLLDLSLGLSYEVGRVNIGAGYRWERYFDVLDVGYTEHESADRTIDGPYFKIAVGFGG